MITSDHDNFDSCTAAFADSVGDSGTRRINHGHETNKAQVFKWKIRRVGVFVSLFRVLSRINMTGNDVLSSYGSVAYNLIRRVRMAAIRQ